LIKKKEEMIYCNEHFPLPTGEIKKERKYE
jgi:hypothetical protein